MNIIKIDNESCVGCKTCYKACFIDVLRWDEESKRPVVAYPEDCVNCMVCVSYCPKDAVSIKVDFDHMRDWTALPGDERPKGVEKEVVEEVKTSIVYKP
jgi:NAD-dependent dihydropyrimidine dehydrogenase PreA subunit